MPHCGDIARLHCASNTESLRDFDSLWGSFESRITPKYLTVFWNDMRTPLNCNKGEQSSLRFKVKITASDFCALTDSCTSRQHFSITSKASCRLFWISRNFFPRWRRPISFAYPCDITLAASCRYWTKSSSTTQFHRNGESIPPYGQPANIKNAITWPS